METSVWKAWHLAPTKWLEVSLATPPITETVTVGNEVVLLDFNLYIETYVIEQAAEVVAKVDRSRDVYMENIKKKSAASMDFISSQQIKQAGDSDAAGAIKRVPGVSTVGNFVFVRGLSDRYIKTTLNGAEVPSMNLAATASRWTSSPPTSWTTWSS